MTMSSGTPLRCLAALLRRFRSNLTFRLVGAYLLFSVLSIGLAVSVTFFTAKNILREGIYERLNISATLKEDALNRWIADQTNAALFLANARGMQAQLDVLTGGQPDHPDYDKARFALAALLRDFVTHSPNILEAFVMTAVGGRVIASSRPESEGTFKPTYEYFQQGGQRTFVQSVYPSPETLKPTLTIATPVKDAEGDLQAVLALHLNLQRLDRILREKAGLGESGETYLVDRFYTLVSSEGFRGADGAHALDTLGVTAALQGRNGSAQYRNHRGVSVVGVFRWLEQYRMALLAEMSQAEAFAPAQRLAWHIVLVGLGSVALIAVGMLLLSRRIARPIVAISDTATKMAEGQLDLRAPVLGEDEVGSLARAFNSLMDRLQARIHLEYLLADISRQFISLPSQEKESRTFEALLQVGTVLGATRGYTLFLSPDRTIESTFLWPEPHMPAWSGLDVHAALRERVGLYLEALRNQDVLTVAQGRPVQRHDPEAEAAWQSLNVPALLLVPMISRERTRGFLGFESLDPHWRVEPEDAQLVRTMGEILCNAMERIQARQELLHLNSSLEEQVAERTAELTARTWELQAAYEQLQKQDRLKSSFLMTVSHEIRTPLTSVLGFAKLIRKDLEKNPARIERALDNVSIIEQEGQRLSRMLNDVLEMARIQSGQIEWSFARVSLAEIVDSAVRSVRSLLEQKPAITLENRLPADLPSISADPVRLRQVFVHLLDNAIKFSTSGTIRIQATRPDPDRLRVGISDQGTGIRPDQLSKIFDTFYQADYEDMLTTKPSGAGLGLPLCREILRCHNATIHAESAWGQGSTIHIDFTLLPAGAPPRAGQSDTS